MSFKVCEVVRAQESIRAGEDDDSWAIASSKPSIFLMTFAKSNLRLFPWFLNRWSCLDRLDDSCHRKYRARERLVEVRDWWRIDRKTDDESTCQGNRRRDRWEHHQSRWRSRIRDRSFNSMIVTVVLTVSSSLSLSSLDESMNLSFVIIIVQDKILIISEIKKICNK